MKLEAYITINFEGRASKGEAAIAIVVMKAGEPESARIVLFGYSNISYQRAQSLAALDMIKLMKKPVDLKVTVPELYMFNIMTGIWKAKKNKEDWMEYLERAAGMNTCLIEIFKNHKYKASSIIRTQKGGYHMTDMSA